MWLMVCGVADDLVGKGYNYVMKKAQVLPASTPHSSSQQRGNWSQFLMGDPGLSFRRFPSWLKNDEERNPDCKSFIYAMLCCGVCSPLPSSRDSWLWVFWMLEVFHLLSLYIFVLELSCFLRSLSFLKPCLQRLSGQEGFGSWRNFSTNLNCG